MNWYRAHRSLSWIAAAALVVAAAVAVWVWTLPSNSDGLSLGDYGPDEQRDWAERVIAGLNMHDVERVPVFRFNGTLSAEQRQAIEQAMPAVGCRYELVSVQDGEEQRQEVPGLPTVDSTYRFDATVDERCLDQSARTRALAVVAIAEMGYWEPYLLRVY